MATQGDRRAYRRSQVQVHLELSDLRGAISGRTVDVSRGGLLASTAEAKSVGTLLRVRVLSPNCDSALAVGVVVRSSSQFEPSDPEFPQGVAIALTATSEAWDRFWDDLSAGDRKTGVA